MWNWIAKKIVKENPLYWYNETIGDVLNKSKDFIINYPDFVECETCGCLLNKDKKYFSHYETEKIPNLPFGTFMITVTEEDRKFQEGYSLKPKEVYFCKKCKPKK